MLATKWYQISGLNLITAFHLSLQYTKRKRLPDDDHRHCTVLKLSDKQDYGYRYTHLVFDIHVSDVFSANSSVSASPATHRRQASPEKTAKSAHQKDSGLGISLNKQFVLKSYLQIKIKRYCVLKINGVYWIFTVFTNINGVQELWQDWILVFTIKLL